MTVDFEIQQWVPSATTPAGCGLEGIDAEKDR